MAIRHAIVSNFAAVSITAITNIVWKWTRAMQKAGAKYLASSDGSAKEITGDPALDKWLGTAGTSNAGAAAASIAAPSRGKAVVTGLTGLVDTEFNSDKGRFLVITGAATGANNHRHRIERVISASSCEIDARTFAVASDANNGALTWSIWDPLTEAYPSGAINAPECWSLWRLTSIIKIPFTAAPVAGAGGFTFIRGENIVQATSGWEGEVIGVSLNPATGVGYLVAMCRVRTTAPSILPTTALVFTGSISGATVTQNGTALEYRREVLIWKEANATQGTIYHNIVEPVAETTLESLLGAAGCTITVGPGGGGTGNAFPTTAYVQVGSSTGVGVAWTGLTGGGVDAGLAQISVADMIEESGISPDGSYWVAIGTNDTSAGGAGANAGWWHMRMDDAEDGDLDPFADYAIDSSNALYSPSRTAPASAAGVALGETFTIAATVSINSLLTGNVIRGWRNKGLAAGDAFQDFEFALVRTVQTAGAVTTTASAPSGTANNTDYERVATDPRTLRARVLEPVRVISCKIGAKMRKGSCRWLYWIQGGNGMDRQADGTLIQLSSAPIAMCAGPWNNDIAQTA